MKNKLIKTMVTLLTVASMAAPMGINAEEVADITVAEPEVIEVIGEDEPQIISVEIVELTDREVEASDKEFDKYCERIEKAENKLEQTLIKADEDYQKAIDKANNDFEDAWNKAESDFDKAIEKALATLGDKEDDKSIEAYFKAIEKANDDLDKAQDKVIAKYDKAYSKAESDFEKVTDKAWDTYNKSLEKYDSDYEAILDRIYSGEYFKKIKEEIILEEVSAPASVEESDAYEFKNEGIDSIEDAVKAVTVEKEIIDTLVTIETVEDAKQFVEDEYVDIMQNKVDTEVAEVYVNIADAVAQNDKASNVASAYRIKKQAPTFTQNYEAYEAMQAQLDKIKTQISNF